MTPDDFAAAVKAKHPEYAEVDNTELTNRMLDKFPQYKDQVTFPAKSSAWDVAKALPLPGLLGHAKNVTVDAAENVMGAGKAVGDAGKTLLQLATGPSPVTSKQAAIDNALQTPIAQDIKNTPKAIGEGLQSFMRHPLESMAKHPVTTAGVVLPLAEAGMANLSKLGQVMETTGARGQNYAASLRPQTIKAMTKMGENPGDVGVRVGSQLAKDDIVGSSAKETYSNLLKAHNTAGQEVGNALKAINKESLKFGDVENPLAVEQKTALQPLSDAVQEFKDSMTAARKRMGKPFEQVYTSLTEKAGKQSGLVSLDDIRKAMKEIGPMTHKGTDLVQEAMSELYGTLANVQDGMITELAKATKNPKLKTALLEANQKYSLYSRILPDLFTASAKESVGSSSILAHPIEAAKKIAASNFSGKLARSGKALQGFPIADQPGVRSALAKAANKIKR